MPKRTDWSELLSRLVIGAAVLLIGCATAGACTMVAIPKKVGPTFSVFVRDSDGRGVAGVPVSLAYRTSTDYQGVTDQNGEVHFSGVVDGTYDIQSSVPAFFSGVVADVGRGHPEGQIEIQWPSGMILKTREVAGVLYLGPQSRAILEGATLNLLDARNGNVIGSSKPGLDGSFEFSPMGEGLYFLQFKPTRKFDWWEGLISIQIDHSAPAGLLDISGRGGSCGLWYTAPCQERIELNSICGRLVDVMGAEESGTLKVMSGNQILAEAATDRNGRFQFGSLPDGEYMIAVEPKTLLNARIPWSVKVSAPSCSREKTLIEVSAGGTCSGSIKTKHAQAH